MAQDAELKLKVSLDLGFFRQQLAGLGQASAGYSLPVQVKFDRRSVQDELNALGTNIKRRNYRLNIETNLSAEIAKADTLARKLNELSGKIRASSGGAFSGGPQGAAGLEKFMREQGLTGKAFGVQQAQENIAKQAILARLQKGSLSKGGYNTAGLEKIIRDLGGTPSGGRKDLVGQAKKLVEESNGIADAVFDSLKDLQMKLRPIRGQAQTSAARSMPNLNQMLDRIANLTENPRAAQRMLRMMPESRLTTDLVGAANKQAAIKEAGPGKFLDLRGKAFDPLLKVIAESFTDYTRSVNASNPWVGKIGSGMTELIGRALTQSPEQMFGGRTPALSNKLLPSIGGTTSPINTLERRLAQSRGALGTGGGVAGSLFTGRGLANPGVSMLEPVGLSGNYRGMAAALANQAANPALAHRQIADIGFGGVPTAATGMSGQALNRALNQAFLQRRGLGIGGGQSLPIFNTPGVAVQQNIPGMAHQMGGGGLGGSMGMFPTAGMMGPSSSLGRITAQSSMFAGGGGAMPPGGGGGFGGMGGLGGFGRAMGGINLPGAGAIRELGDEFGFATKQVLLFGQAYKLLGFLQSFPGQVGAAVGQLQTFRNTLGAISPNAQEAAASNQLILDLVEKYNVPLQSARDGFTKLYASMAPAGFSGDEIRNLFTGITQAAATFGMSADKVDRVNYAFAQMASKGQVMSEELKGQLGDVLPGAMSIFAKAAGFKGPKAIQDFSAALEAGSYKGKAMVALLKNVGVVMKQEFGPGAEGAALTFQGVINRMQNSMTLLYESFEPVAVGFLNTIVVPLTSGIKQISDGFNAFFTGTTATTTGGGVFAQQLQSMLPAIKGIKDNITGLIPVFRQFGAIAGQVAQFLLQIAGNPVVGYLAKLYLVALPLNIAFNALTSVIRSVIGSMTTLNVGLLAGSQRFTTYRILMDATGLSAAKLTGILRGVAPALNLVTVGLRAIAGPVILIGISLLIERFMMLKGAIDGVGQSTKQMLAGISSMANTGAVGALENTAKDLQKQIQTFESLRSFVSGGALGPSKQLTPGAAKTMEELGMGSFVSKTILGKPQINDFINASKIIEARLQGLRKAASGVQEKLPLARRVAASIEAQTKPTETISPIPPGEGDEKGAKKAVNDAEQLAKQQQQRRIEQANFDNDMDKINFDHKMQLSDAAFEHAKQLIDERNQYELSGLNDMQARQVKFAQDLKKIRLNAEDAIRKAIQKTEAAQLNVATAQRTAQAAGVSAATNSGPVIGGFTSTQLSGATTAASKFTGIANMCSESVKAFYKSLGISLPGVTAWADTVRNAGTTMRDWSKLAPGDIVATGRPGDTPHVGVYTGGQNVFHQSRSRGLKAGNYPDLDYFKQGGYFVRPNTGVKQSSASFSMDTKMQKESFDLQKQYAQSANQINLQTLEIERAIQLAKEQTATTIKANIDNLFPVEKQKLDLRLQQMRHNLLMQGMPQEYIDYEEKRALATEEATMASQEMTANIAKAKAELSEYNLQIAKGIQLLPEQKGDMAVLNNQIKANEQGLKDLAKAQQESNIIALESAIATMKQADALKAMEEVSGRINDAVEGVTGTYKSMFKEIAMGGDSVEALKKAQQALADQFLTMVFDMAMKPVEESMKNTLGKMFGVPDEKKEREKTITAMEKQLAELEASKKLQEGIKGDTAAIRNGAGGGATPAPPAPSVPGQTTAAGGTYGTQTHPFIKDAGNMYSTLPFNGQTGGMLQTLPFNGQTSSMYQNAPSNGGAGFLSSIGIDSEALSASITDSANAYSDQLGKIDTSVFESATALGTAGTELGKEGAAGKKWHESLGQAVGGLGMAAGAVMGIVAGINQIKEGGTSNVLGGIGMIASMAGSLLGSFGGLFGGGGGASSIVKGVDVPVSQMPAGMAFANGGIAPGGFRAFANGGTVSGPTLGLIGEGKYNEAVVPLPDGKSIPVQFSGERSARDMMSRNAQAAAQASPINLSFETTKIGNTEYVSRDQLEAAMAETRRAAINGGAARGMSMTLDRIQQSPSTRSRIGIR